MSKMSDPPKQLEGRIIFMSMFNDISYRDFKTMNKNVSLTSTSFLSMQEDFHQEDGHSSDLDQKQSGIPLTMKDQEENVTKSLN